MPQLVPRVIQVLELANVASAEINAQSIDTEHLLLGILREGGGMAVTLLQIWCMRSVGAAAFGDMSIVHPVGIVEFRNTHMP